MGYKMLSGYELMAQVRFCPLCGHELKTLHTSIEDVRICNNHETTVVPEADLIVAPVSETRSNLEARGLVLRVLDSKL